MHLFFEGSTVGRTRFADAPSNILRNTFNLIYHYNSKNKYRQTLSTFYISIYRPLFLKISKKLIYFKNKLDSPDQQFDQNQAQKPAFRIQIWIHFNPRFESTSISFLGSGSTLESIDLDPGTPKLFRVKSKTKCFCYLRNAFSKFWR